METTATNEASFQGSRSEKRLVINVFVLNALSYLPGLCFVLLMIVGIILSPSGKDNVPASPTLIIGAHVVFAIQLLVRKYNNAPFKWSELSYTISFVAEAIWMLALINLMKG